MTDQEAERDVEQFLRDAFDDNYEVLRLQTARTLSADGRRAALEQVLLYWRKMRDVAERITDTEVRLTLPNQTSPDGHQFSIHGIVDIVRDDDRIVMYDIKTLDAEYVSKHIDVYTDQLNVYAHIWCQLQGEFLDETGIICTRLPSAVSRALESDEDDQLEYALQGWEPLVSIPFDEGQIEQTIEDFGDTVDAIEEREFSPVPFERLHERVYRNQTFAFRVCRQCDARFSCETYRRCMQETQPRDDRQYWSFFTDLGLEDELESWRTANLEEAATADDLAADYD